MAKIIVGIHGLGNKPHFNLLEQWWKSSICEGLKHISKPHKYFKFYLVSWSDLIYEKPEDYNLTDINNPLFVSEPYLPALSWDLPKSDNRRKKIRKFFEEQLEKILINTDGTVNFTSITDKIIQRYFRDLDAYYSGELLPQSDKMVRDAIRERLHKVLLKYQGQSIMLIAHSMGSIISYDVLKKYENELSIDTLVTIGSPLGLPMILGKIIKEHGGGSIVPIPNNIKKNWFNFSDLEDKVAMNYDLADDYAPSLSGTKITDFEVFNNYEVNGLRNPHKVYGYLRTPKLAEKIDEFLMAGKSRFSTWFTRKINEFLK